MQRVRCGPQHGAADFQGSSPVCSLVLLDCRPSVGSCVQNPALNPTIWARMLTVFFWGGKEILQQFF